MRTACAISALLVVILFPIMAHAQEPGKTGLVMGYPASFGVIWQAGEKVALRPEMTFTWASNDSLAASTGGTTSNWQLGAGVSALFYFARHDNLRPYFSPQWRYSHLGSSGTASNDGNGNQLNGMFGAQYALGDRFGIYGETGAGYSWTTTTLNVPTTFAPPASYTLHGKAFGVSGRAGVIFYF